MPLTIIAHIHAKPEHQAFIKTELEKLIAPSRQDKGCLEYHLHQDNDDPNYFMFYENWESRELWLEHMETPHLQAYKTATQDKVAQFALHEMTQSESL